MENHHFYWTNPLNFNGHVLCRFLYGLPGRVSFHGFLRFSDNSRTALGEWMRYAAPELRQATCQRNWGGTGGSVEASSEGHLNGKVWVEASIYE